MVFNGFDRNYLWSTLYICLMSSSTLLEQPISCVAVTGRSAGNNSKKINNFSALQVQFLFLSYSSRGIT